MAIDKCESELAGQLGSQSISPATGEWKHFSINSAGMKTVVLASRNAKKSAEIDELLSPYGIHVVSVQDFGNVPEVVEDGTTFAENAQKKACQTARHVGHWTIGEDSGLCVDALGSAPGAYSARYNGATPDDEQNNDKLLEALADVPDDRRQAGYVCHVAVSDPAGDVRLEVEAGCRGRILRERRGTHGFGYDPLFLIPELHRTFGELGPVVKRHIGHRARAFGELIRRLGQLLGSDES